MKRLALMCLALAGCTAPEPTDPPAFTLLSVSCDANHGTPRADVSLRNDGPAVEYAKAYVQFGPVVRDGYLRPTSVPSGSIATAVIYGNAGDSANCDLVSVQDRSGVVASLNR